MIFINSFFFVSEFTIFLISLTLACLKNLLFILERVLGESEQNSRILFSNNESFVGRVFLA
jgi:hypothetical protein